MEKAEIKKLGNRVKVFKASIKEKKKAIKNCESDEQRKKLETTLKGLETKLANAEKAYKNAKAERWEKRKANTIDGVKSIGTKTGLIVTGTILVIGAAAAYEYFKKTDEVEVASDNV